MPYVGIRLTNALLDSGASVNVLPFTLGNQLGLVWEEPSYIFAAYPRHAATARCASTANWRGLASGLGV